MQTYKLLKMDEVNKNDVLVPSSEVYLFLHDEYDGNPILCGYDKPSAAFSRIDLNNVSHQLHNLRMRDSYLIGDIEPLDTHYGNILKDLIKNGQVEFPACYHGVISVIDDIKHVSDIKLMTCFPCDNLAFI